MRKKQESFLKKLLFLQIIPGRLTRRDYLSADNINSPHKQIYRRMAIIQNNKPELPRKGLVPVLDGICDAKPLLTHRVSAPYGVAAYREREPWPFLETRQHRGLTPDLP